MLRIEEAKSMGVYKTVQILNCFLSRPLWGVSEIAREVGLCKSNVSNIVSTLRDLGYLEQEIDSGKYRLGNGIFDLSKALGDSFSITKIAAPYLHEIAKACRERVCLAMAQETHVRYLDSAYPAGEYEMMRSMLGVVADSHCTGVGKAIMAYLSSDALEEYLKGELKRYTEYTLGTRKALLEEMKEIRRRGYAIDNMEHEFGIKCQAVPIFNSKKEPCFAVSISGPSLRISEDRYDEIYHLIQTYTRKIEAKL